MRTTRFLGLVVCFAMGCGPETGGPGPKHDMAGQTTCLHPPPDNDGDGISDTAEGGPGRDSDGDGKPDFRDLDSDGDGVPDAIEGRNATLCDPPFDSDGDGKPDFIDVDSDSSTDATVGDREEIGADPMQP